VAIADHTVLGDGRVSAWDVQGRPFSDRCDSHCREAGDLVASIRIQHQHLARRQAVLSDRCAPPGKHANAGPCVLSSDVIMYIADSACWFEALVQSQVSSGLSVSFVWYVLAESALQRCLVHHCTCATS
jgi:hypothetical protein